ncbi:MAG: hypothetical protein KBE91_12175 [Bacteroidia bacterium]|nr:hypothetical protein [Bacteroidia bacterium]MBP9690364.1 hypothetical protein [Bacteroidia bacterium]
MKLKTLTYLAVLALFLGSCATKKMNESIAKYYPYYQDYETTDTSDAVLVQTDAKLISNQQPSYVRQVKNVFIPALIFWKWNLMYKCELDKKQELEKLCSDIKADCYKLKLDSILPNQKLELTIAAVPTSFTYQDKGFMFIYLYGYLYRYSKIAFPIIKENLTVTYKLYSKNNLVKEGTIVIDDIRIENSNPNSTAIKVIDNYVMLCRDHLYQAKNEFIAKLQTEIAQ